jgi:hypothetical protein
VVAHEFSDTRLHFFRGLIGEGECENLKWVDTLVDKVRNAVGKYACFTGAGACDNHERTIHMGRSSALRFVQFG